MKEFRKKQKIFSRIMKSFVIFTAAFIFVFIGAEPYVQEASAAAANYISTLCDFLVIAAVVLLFVYYNRYSKCDSFLENIEYEISDWGYYYSQRGENTAGDMAAGILADVKKDGFNVRAKLEIGELDFEFCALKKNEFFYCAYVERAEREDMLAYLDAAINDVTVANLKRKGSLVLCIVTDKAEDSAIALSKTTVPLGKKEQLKAVYSIIETGSKKCYFLGNKPSKCQQIILSYIMKCKSPIDSGLKGERQLEFQRELEKHMESFDLKAFKDGSFSAH
ncbi:MAG: hypothetical protein LUH82_04210 [Clostridiales bacterium]|nr:hypothetical protein [Clostridiales bacterium]